MKSTIATLGLLSLFICSDLRAADVVWNQRGTAWEDPANWSAGRVPGPEDVAVFPDPNGPVKNQPIVNSTDPKVISVGGIAFHNTGSKNVQQPNMKLSSYVGWIIGGHGKLIVGKQGISIPSAADAIYPDLELAAMQPWSVDSDRGRR